MLATCLTWVSRTWPAMLIVTTLLVGCSSGNALLRKQGVEAFDADDLYQADQHFSEAISQDPTDWKSLYFLGQIRLKQGRWLEAHLSLERAYELRHHHEETADILDALAEALSQQNRAVALNALLDKAIEAYGTSRDYTRKGRHLQRLGDIDAAKLAYRKAAFFATEGNAGPFLTLADFYESISDTTNAIVALRHAYTVTPGNPIINNRLRRYGIVPGPTTGLTPETMQR